MPSLADLVNPATTAVCTMELQRGVTGDQAAMVELAKEVRAAGVIDNAARLCAAARRAGAQVVHCTAAWRDDQRGAKVNSRIQAAALKLNQGRLDPNHPGSQVMPELDPQPSDVIVQRLHGMTPFISTPLDQILRNMGIETVIAVGNSLNIGIPGMCMNAVDLGYQVVVPRDAVAGTPKDYADMVLQYTVAMLASVVSTDDIIAAWG